MRRTLSLPWVIVLAGVIHLSYAWGLWFAGDLIRNAAILGGFGALTDTGLSSRWIAAFLAGITLLAWAALILEGRPRVGRPLVLAMIFPQWVMLIVAISVTLYVIASGHVNGRSVDRNALVAVLGGFLGAAIFHTLAILERYFDVVLYRWGITRA